MIRDILLVGIGSFVGGSLRMVISKYVQLAVAGSFPLGTMVVNVVGCFLIGLLSALPADNGTISPAVRLLLTTGFCGGFTTFSTFSVETIQLLQSGRVGAALSYQALSLLGGLGAALLGRSVALRFG